MIATITQALQRGDIATALSAAQAFAASDPQNPQAHHWLGICLQRSGDIAGARVAIDQAINLAPDRADFQISRAALALGQKDYEAAEKGMKDAVSLDPNQLQAYVTLAHMALARGENEEAARQLKLAQRVNPDNPHVLLLEGHIAQYGGQAEKALQCFTAAAEIEADNILAQVSLGIAYGTRGMWSFAEQAMKNAMALEPSNPGAMRGLVRSQLQQEKFLEAIDVLGQWLITKPSDSSARMMRAQIRAEIGQMEQVLEDLMMVNDLESGNPRVVLPLANTLLVLGRHAEAVELLEQTLSIQPQHNVLWSMRIKLTADQLPITMDVLNRWLAVLPESPQAHEALAQVQENNGELGLAEASADKALALEQNVPFAQFVKLRAEIRKDPKQALARLEMLEKVATNAEAQRMVFAWRGLACDKLRHYDKAAESFIEMARRPLAQHPLPNIFPTHNNDNTNIAGTLLWAPTGVRAEIVLQALAEQPNSRLLAGRNSAEARNDGFGHVRYEPGAADAGTAEKWQEEIRKLDLDPANVIDWIPHFDGFTASELTGLRTIAVMIDPRDAFLNWMVFGSAQAYMFLPEPDISAEWLALTCEAFATHLESHPEQASIVKVDDLPEQGASVALALQAALGLDQAPDEKILNVSTRVLGDMESKFPSGHWRHYRNSFKAAFERLTPVAVRLGYPED